MSADPRIAERDPRSSIRSAAAGLIAVLLLLLQPLPVFAATVTVSTADELRSALAEAGTDATTIDVGADIRGGFTIP